MIKDMPLTIGYHYDPDGVVGVVTLNEQIEAYLANGQTIRLIPALRRENDGTKTVVSLTILSTLEPAESPGLKLRAEVVSKTIERLHEAYAAPSGTWAQRWVPFVCKHEKVRCIHGDEIHTYKGRRIKCLVCGRALKGEHPRQCFFNGEPHGD